jgi:hypothetical protein
VTAACSNVNSPQALALAAASTAPCWAGPCGPAGQALVAQHCAIDDQLSCHMEVSHLVQNISTNWIVTKAHKKSTHMR